MPTDTEQFGLILASVGIDCTTKFSAQDMKQNSTFFTIALLIGVNIDELLGICQAGEGTHSILDIIDHLGSVAGRWCAIRTDRVLQRLLLRERWTELVREEGLIGIAFRSGSGTVRCAVVLMGRSGVKCMCYQHNAAGVELTNEFEDAECWAAFWFTGEEGRAPGSLFYTLGLGRDGGTTAYWREDSILQCFGTIQTQILSDFL